MGGAWSRRAAAIAVSVTLWSLALPVVSDLVETIPVARAAVSSTASYVRLIDTSAYSPPAPDAAGVVYLPATDRLMICDSEVEEMSIWAGSNLFAARRNGSQLYNGTTTAYSIEPTGLGFNPDDLTLFVSDDDADKIFQVKHGSDGRYGTSDDVMTSFSTRTWNDGDPEDVDYNEITGKLYILDGVGTEVWILTKGANGKFDGPSPAGDDGLTHFDMGAFGATDIEGIGHNPTTGNLLLADRGTKKAFEVSPTGVLLQTITLNSTLVKKPSDITAAPASDGSSALHLYVSDRGVDNDNTPSENDGKVHELTYPGSSVTNSPPSVNAGPNLSVSLPNGVTLSGSVTDDGLPNPPGSTNKSWTKQSGPGTVTFGSPSAAVSTATFSSAGTYVLRLTASDSVLSSFDEATVVVNPQNLAPTVNAGPDQNVSLPSGVTMNGTVSDDGQPNPPAATTKSWTKQSGPGTVTFGTPNAAVSTATFSAAGTYVLRLTVSDSVLSSFDEVSVVVGPQNFAPTVNAGPDKTIALPSGASLNGTVNDDGLPNPPATTTKSWTKQSGPGTVTFGTPNAAATTASFSQAGSYVLRLTTSDSQLSAFDEVTITVNPQNFAPSVDAGPDQTIALPSGTTLNGTVTDDGLPNPPGSTTKSWTQQSGPGTVTFGTPNAAATTAAFSEAGTYVLRLTGDDSTLSAFDELTVEVDPQNVGPTADAGPDQSITLPSGTTLNGTVTDDGLPDPPASTTISWTNRSGPGTVTFGTPDAAVTGASFSVAGTYVLRLTADDGALDAFDEVTVEVAPQNSAPVVDAGPDLYVAQPDQAALNGSATDDGLPDPPNLVISWTLQSGPGAVTFGSPDAATSTASFSDLGTYVLRVIADDGELSTFDEVTVVVGDVANVDPEVDAGPDQEITLPDGANLSGSVTDDGVPDPPAATTATWTKHSGPGIVTFGDAAAATTTTSFSVAGTYVLRLTGSDGVASVFDEVTVVVFAQNFAPVVDAGPDLDIALPSGATLNGTVTDEGLPDPPASTTKAWTQESGPETVSFGSPDAAVTTASFSAAGTYVLRLTASDSVLSAFDEVTVVVDPENFAPGVDAGSDQEITLPSGTTLSGAVTDDGLPDPPATLTASWTKQSGAGTVTFGTPNAAVSTASFSAAGTYVLRLTGSDSAVSVFDDVTVVVNPQNFAPVASAGPDVSVKLANQAALNGSVNDDGLPNPPATTTKSWTLVSGPGAVTFSAPNAAITNASFSSTGTYVLRLTASDSVLSASDDVTVTVTPNTTSHVINVNLKAGTDDAEQRGSSGKMDLTSTDLEMIFDGSTKQVVGLRFAGVNVPRGAVITKAYVQFTVDEVSTDTSNLTIKAQAVDNAATFTSTALNISSRTQTTESVVWAALTWPTVGAAGADQRTPDVKVLIQRVVDRTGWSANNAMVLIITGTSGRRTAEAFEGTAVPVLHIEYDA